MSIFTISFRVEKSIIIDKDKKEVWKYVSDFEKQNIWSPRIMFERDCEQKIEGESNTIGYKEYWKGNIIGEGEQILQEIKLYEKRTSTLNFIKPFKSKNHTTFELEEIGDNKTKLTWSMIGQLPFFLFFMKKSMVHFIGNDFERGLVMLKDLLETGKIETSTKFIGVQTLPKKYFVGFKGKGTITEMSENMGNEFQGLHNFLAEKNKDVLSTFTKYTNSDLLKDYFEYNACLEISEDDYKDLQGRELGNYFLGVHEETKVAKTTHFGSYKYLPNSWSGAYMYLKPHGLKENKKNKPLEVYEIGPGEDKKESEYITYILVPVK